MQPQNKLETLKGYKTTALTFLRWNQERKQWLPSPEDFNDQPHIYEELTTITYNVLTDQSGKKEYRPNVLYSSERYTAIFNDLQTMNVDIATFNEVTSTFHEMLIGCDWVKKNYFVSPFLKEEEEVSYTNLVKNFIKYRLTSQDCNIMISKIKPLFLEKLKISTIGRPIPMGCFHFLNKKKEEKIIMVSAVHLISLASNRDKRVVELSDLMKEIDKYEGVVDGFIFQGDMNFHSEEQNVILPQLNLKDAWLQLHNLQQNPGYTFDGMSNNMINQIYWGYEKRSMRLDRIFMRGQALSPSKMEVIFNQPIFGENVAIERRNLFKRGVSFVSDILLNYNAYRTKEQYLFRSDHFGLLAKLLIK